MGRYKKVRAGASLSSPSELGRVVRRELVALALVASMVLLMAAPLVRGDLEGSVPDATAFTTQRKLVRLSNGTLALAFVIQVNGSNRVQVAESADGVVWTSLDPPSLQTPSADRPSLAVDSRDTLHLAWTANGTGDRQVWYASYAQGVWSAPLQISETVGYSGFPSIAVDSRDRVHVAWYGYDGTYYQIYYRMKDASGWGPQIAVTAQALDATNPALALDGSDRIHIVWYHLNTRGTEFQVSYASLANGNVTLQTLSSPSEVAFDPTLAVGPSNTVYVAWTSAATNSSRSRIAFVQESNGVWSSPVTITPSAVNASHPSLAVDPAGNVYLFYESGDAQIHEEQQTNGTWSPPVQISSGSSNTYPSARWSYYPARAPAGNATVDVVWTQAVSGGFVVRFASEPARTPPPAPAAIPWIDVGLAVVLVAVIAGGYFIRRRARR